MNNEKYAFLLSEVAELLKQKNEQINIQAYKIETLERRLQELESGVVCKRRIERR